MKLDEHIQELHSIYRAGNLRVLVGAGASVPSDLPSWDQLNYELLRKHVSDVVEVSSDLKKVTEAIYRALGRDSVAELVYRAGDADGFKSNVSDALYRGRKPEELYIGDLQKQIVALALPTPQRSEDDNSHHAVPRNQGPSVAQLFTTNFDPLLENALALAYEKVVEQYDARAKDGLANEAAANRKPRNPSDFRLNRGPRDVEAHPGLPKINHIHGWIDDDGHCSGTLVFAESQYMALQSVRSTNAEANATTTKLFSMTGATIVVGMSMQDPNIRRLLYERGSNALLDSGSSVYFITRRDDSDIDRKYLDIIERFVESFWHALRVKVLWVDGFEDVPNLLRRIQWGGFDDHKPPAWIDFATKRSTVTYNVLRDREFFEIVEKRLKLAHDFIQTRYVTDSTEKLSLELFMPVLNADSWKLSEVGCVGVNGAFEADSPETLVQNAINRSLDITQGKCQGLAGEAFVTGSDREANDGIKKLGQVDRHFDPSLVTAFDRGEFRNWRSIIGFTVLAEPYCLPVAVLCVKSNRATPFWEVASANNPNRRDEGISAIDEEKRNTKTDLRQTCRKVVKEIMKAMWPVVERNSLTPANKQPVKTI